MVEDLPPYSSERERARADEQRRRWRLLYGRYRADVEQRVRDSLGIDRARRIGPVDMSANPFSQVWTKAAALYRAEPEVVPPEGASAFVGDFVADAGYWQLMQRVQRDAGGVREMPVFLDVVGERKGPNGRDTRELVARPVEPYLVEVESDPRRPTRALAVTHWQRRRTDPSRWVRVIFDPIGERYVALDEDTGEDVSAEQLGGTFTGAAYPWRWADGTPFLPWEFYRAAKTSTFWDSFTGGEVVEGSLTLSVLLTFYGHLVRNASWSQKYTVNASPVGGSVDEHTGERRMVADPASVLQFESIPESTAQPQVSQWSPSGDPEKILASVLRYENRILEMALGSVHVTRRHSDVRSAQSLAVSREEERDLQRAFEPLFRPVDESVLAKVAAMLGEPEDGWQVRYRSLPMDPAARKTLVESLEREIALGLRSRLSAYMELHPSLTVEEARRDLESLGDGITREEVA